MLAFIFDTMRWGNNAPPAFNFVFSKISPLLIVRGQNPGKYKDTTSPTEGKGQRTSDNASPQSGKYR